MVVGDIRMLGHRLFGTRAYVVRVPVVPWKAIEIGEARRAVVIVEALTRENYAYFTDLGCTKETMQPATAGKTHLRGVAEGAASKAASNRENGTFRL